MTESLYMGKPLSEYSKAELIAIIEEMGAAQQAATIKHMRQLDFFRERAAAGVRKSDHQSFTPLFNWGQVAIGTYGAKA